ncbi:MAG: hypothetical protein NT150_03515 [Bacteroidetes bacterium]|nr:hypothetical protein [Bacteroidota bacterium]
MKTVGVIDYAGSFKALIQLIDQHNSMYYNAGKKIKSGMIRTAEILIKIYGVFLLKNKNAKISGDLAPLKTSNAQLATMQKCSTRTIQRHLDRLELARVLMRKEKGNEMGIEIWINRDLLLEKIVKEENKLKSVQSFIRSTLSAEQKLNSPTTKCLHSEEEPYLNNNIIIAVSSVEKSERPKNEMLFNHKDRDIEGTGYTEGKVWGRSVDAVEKLKNESSVPGTSRHSFVEMLWDLSKKLLYRKTYLTQSQNQKAVQLIETLYAPVENENLQKVHANYCKRINLVKRYVNKNPSKRFVPLPYIFFDTKNIHGFCGTKKWLQQQVERRKQVKKECLLLEELNRYWENEKCRDNMRIPVLRMYRLCEASIKGTGDLDLLNRFYEGISLGTC